MKCEKKISSPTIKRLPVYYRSLSALMQLGVQRISSRDLSNIMGITSSQVRQDFSDFGSNGLQGYGYEVESLHREIHNLLGLHILQNMIIIGSGSFGQALAKHTDFEKKGFKIVGIFDINAQLIGKKIREIEIRHLDTLGQFVQNNRVDIAAITVPEAYANEIASLVISLGIKGIWNFAPIELKVPNGIIIENIHLIDSLMILGYKLIENDKEINS
jgi:redox-sensing transcriptional repressor